jgi:large subunit ribosomal protein L29
MQKATGQLPPAKTHEARRVRREIARVNMLLGQK